jgi:hypothetical protein
MSKGLTGSAAQIPMFLEFSSGFLVRSYGWFSSEGMPTYPQPTLPISCLELLQCMTLKGGRRGMDTAPDGLLAAHQRYHRHLHKRPVALPLGNDGFFGPVTAGACILE